jgi:hypothetical protein
MNRGFKAKKRSDDWSGISGWGARDATPIEFRVYASDAMRTVDNPIDKEEFRRHVDRPLDPYLLELWQPYANSIKLTGTIREPRPSTFQRVTRTFTRVVLAVLLVNLIRTTYENKSRISRPPGSVLGSIAEFIFSTKTVELVVTPIISDKQVEYCEALAAGRKIKAGWVRLRGYWSLFKALGLYSIVKMFFEMWRKLSSG